MSLANWTITTGASNSPFGATEYKILDATVGSSGQGTLSPDSSQVSLTYLVEWTYLNSFIDALLGTATVQSGMLSRVLPEEHPTFQSYYAQSIDFKPYGKPSQNGRTPGWNKAAVTCVFRPNSFDVKQDSQVSSELQRFCIKDLTTKVDYLTTQCPLYFVTGSKGSPLGAQAGFLLPNQVLTVQWLKIPVGQYGIDYSPMDTYVKSKIGQLNSTTFELWGLSTMAFAGSGQMCFLDYKTTRVLPSSATGSYYWNIEYTFGIRFNGWNYYYNSAPAVQAWQLVSTDGTATGGTVYPAWFDFNQLFNVGNFV